MPIIQQSVFACHDSTLPVQCFSARELSGAISAIVFSRASVLGLSIQLSKDGHVDAIALATEDEAFFMLLPTSPIGQPRTHASNSSEPRPLDFFSHIFSQISTTTIVAFSMAKIALLIYGSHGWHTRGADLSTLLISSRERAHTPYDVVSGTVDQRVKRSVIDQLWYPDADDEDYERMRKTCMRAWISAL